MKSRLLEQIHGIRYGFGTQDRPCPEAFAAFETAPSFNWKQVHGVHCAELTDPGRAPAQADGFFTVVPGLPLKISTADCVPILLAKKDGSMIAALHAGWRGTFDKIVRSLWNSMTGAGQPAEWVAVLGPSIKACCYEVSAELAHDFLRVFPDYPPDEILPRDRHLDLARLNQLELRSLGIRDIEILPICTFCHERPKFFSYRRRTKLQTGEAHQCQMSVIMIDALD